MPRSATPSDLLACPGVDARTHAPAVRHGRGGVAPGWRRLHLRPPTAGRTHRRPGRPAPRPPAPRHLRGPRGAHLRPDPIAERWVAPGPWHLSARGVSVRSLPPVSARGAVPGDALGQAFGRRHARAHGHAVVRGLPEGHRRGPAVLAAGRARGAGDRGPQLRARDDRVGRRGGRDPEDADLRDDLVPGLPGDPGPVRPEHPEVVRGGPANVGRGAPVPGPARRHGVLLDLERPHVRERRGVRQRAAALPASGGRTRRRRLRAVALARTGSVRRPGDVPARGRRVAGASRDLERRAGGLDRHGERRRRVALDGPDDVPGRRQRLGSVPEARPVPALAAPGDAPVEVDDPLVERRRRGRGRTRLGPRRRDGAVGRLRQGAPWALGLGHPRVLLRRAPAADLARTRSDPRAGRERPHLDQRQAVRIRRDPQRRAGRRGSRDDRRRRPARP